MQLPYRSVVDYAAAQRALLPPGGAFDWPAGGFGDALLQAMGGELERVGGNVQQVLDTAVELHLPRAANWRIEEYRRIAGEAIAGIAETLPRKTFTVGSRVGDRLWSAASSLTPAIPLLQVDHLLGPLRAGSKVGDGVWGTRGRYVMRVRYYRSVVDPKLLWDALAAFKQAHVFLWLEDISGIGGSYGQN